MGKGLKFIIIGLLILLLVAVFFVLQLLQQRQSLQQNYNDIKEKLNTQSTDYSSKLSGFKSESERLASRAAQLEKEMSILTGERNGLQEKYDLLLKEKDSLVEKLQTLATTKKEISPTSVMPIAQIPAVPESDEYWAGVLKTRADLELKLSDLKEVVGELQIKLDTVSKEKNEVSLRATELEQANQDLTRKAEYNDRLAVNLSSELLREQKDKQHILDQLTVIKQENLSLRARIKELDKTNLALKEKMKSLEDDRLVLEGKIDQMDVNLDRKIQEVAKVAGDIQSLARAQDKMKVSRTQEKGSSEEVELPPIVVKGDRQEAINDLKIISGKIVAINETNNFVVVNLGENQGVTIGRKFEVYRNSVSIGSIEVIQTRKNISAADILSSDPKHKIRIGDTVK